MKARFVYNIIKGALFSLRTYRLFRHALRSFKVFGDLLGLQGCKTLNPKPSTLNPKPWISEQVVVAYANFKFLGIWSPKSGGWGFGFRVQGLGLVSKELSASSL